MKDFDLAMLPKIRKVRLEGYGVCYSLNDVRNFINRHLTTSDTKAILVPRYTNYITYNCFTKILRLSKRESAGEALRLLQEDHLKEVEVMAAMAAQPSFDIDPTRQGITGNDPHVPGLGNEDKEDFKQKIKDVWCSMLQSCNEAKALTEACYKRLIEYKEMLEKEQEKNADNNNRELIRFLAIEYGRTEEERLWREARKSATADANGLYSAAAIGELVGLSTRDMNEFLLEKGFQYKNTKTGHLQPKYKVSETLDEEYAVSEYYKENNDRRYFQLRWTIKGLHLILGTLAISRIENKIAQSEN